MTINSKLFILHGLFIAPAVCHFQVPVFLGVKGKFKMKSLSSRDWMQYAELRGQ